MKAVCGGYLLVWTYFVCRWWSPFLSFLIFLYQPFSLITDLCPPLISHHCPLREGKVKRSLEFETSAFNTHRRFYAFELIVIYIYVLGILKLSYMMSDLAWDLSGSYSSHPSLFLSLFFPFSSCLQRRRWFRIHWKTTQLENGGVFRLKDLLLAQDDDVIWAVYSRAAEQHRLWAAPLLHSRWPSRWRKSATYWASAATCTRSHKRQRWRTRLSTLSLRITPLFLAIAEVGGVPFEILEPVLERCTPEQLYRIEQSNQVSLWD